MVSFFNLGEHFSCEDKIDGKNNSLKFKLSFTKVFLKVTKSQIFCHALLSKRQFSTKKHKTISPKFHPRKLKIKRGQRF